jgi:hypothetical protein
LSRLARAAREGVAGGTARRAREPFVAALRGTGEFLRRAATVERDRLAVEIERAARDIGALGGEPVVPIESLTHGEEAGARPAAARGRLETAFATYGELRRERGAPEPSLDALLRRPASGPDAPHRAPAPLSAAPPAGAMPEPQVVAIESLCYRGRRALERAAELRREIEARLGPGRGLVEVRPLLDELLDLVPLALAESD